MILTVTLFVALAFSSNCDPSEEGGDGTFKFVGTVMPRGNYRIFVRTLPSKELSRLNDENAYGVLGDGTITDGTKFEIQLDWEKRHNPDLARESDPIYVQIYAVKESKKTSLVEQMLFNLSSEVEYEFIYGTPRDQIGVQKFLLGHIPNGTANMEKYVSIEPRTLSNKTYQVVDTDGNFAIELEDTQAETYLLSVYQAKKLQNKDPEVEAKVFTIEDPSTFLNDENELEVKIDFLNGKLLPVEKPKSKAKGTKTFKLSGSIENLPKIDGLEVKGIEVKLFTTDPMAGGGSSSSSSDRIPLKTKKIFCSDFFFAIFLPKEKLKFNFELSESDIQFVDIDANADITKSIDSKKTTLHERLLPKNEIKIGPIYLMLTPLVFGSLEKVCLFEQYLTNPILTQMVENGEDRSRYRYKFGNYEAENDEFALGGEKEKMVNLYHAFLKRKNTVFRNWLIPEAIDAYKLTLQMVHIKPLALETN